MQTQIKNHIQIPVHEQVVVSRKAEQVPGREMVVQKVFSIVHLVNAMVQKRRGIASYPSI